MTSLSSGRKARGDGEEGREEEGVLVADDCVIGGSPDRIGSFFFATVVPFEPGIGVLLVMVGVVVVVVVVVGVAGLGDGLFQSAVTSQPNTVSRCQGAEGRSCPGMTFTVEDITVRVIVVLGGTLSDVACVAAFGRPASDVDEDALRRSCDFFFFALLILVLLSRCSKMTFSSTGL